MIQTYNDKRQAGDMGRHGLTVGNDDNDIPLIGCRLSPCSLSPRPSLDEGVSIAYKR